MVKAIIPVFFCTLMAPVAVAQVAPDNTLKDSTREVGKKTITLSEVVIDNKLNVPAFISRIQHDSSFYKAFRNLHLVGYTAINDIRFLDKTGNSRATLHSKIQQYRDSNCRSMKVLGETVTGDYYDEQRQPNYYTSRMYASLFFTEGRVCGEDNIVGNMEFNTAGKSGIEKHKEQLKMLFFNPGRRIKGIPFVSGKTAIYDDDMASYYDMSIDMEDYNQISCYVFKQKVKPGKESSVVVNEMITWFDDKTYEVVARTYHVSYSAAVYDFDVHMEVQMAHVGAYLVPAVIRYNGNWKIMFKKRERGVFTATLSDFKTAVP
ncbi:MAG TPA: hypothetical protein PKC39_11250 [Ferruginibacter sp.]|nr:hypothetical protein [Ferruginibacter sp.]HMP21525.1 hypothetical protein [Ferruginibacter sp.]